MLLIILRWVHVVLGATWIGFALMGPMFLMPAIADAGPDGGKVMGALQKRGLLHFIPAMAVLTLVSGFWLYWIVSNGFAREYMASRMGMALGTGGVIAVVAFLIGMIVMRPAMNRAVALMQSGGDMAEIQRLRKRGSATARFVAVLLVLAVSTMAVARYL